MHLISTVVGVVGAVVVASLVWLTVIVNSHTQSRLLHIQADAAGAVLGGVVPTIRTPLATAAAVAETSRGDVADVKSYIAPEVGTGSGHAFVSLSLWRLSPKGPVRLLALGKPSTLGTDPRALESVSDKIPGPDALAVVDLMTQTPPRIGYAVESIGTTPRYVVLAEAGTPPHRRALLPAASAFHDLEFAVYLGGRPVASHLLERTTPPPSGSPIAAVRVPYGTSSLYFVASAERPLGGGVLPVLPWIVGALGAVLVVGAVVIAEWLMRRRRTAEHVASENLRLYAEQRSIAKTLQDALLPKRLPVVPGVEFAARYVPGDSSADVGGDWYDVIRCDDHSFLFAIGDVSGRGIPAANVMASLHYAIRAYAAQGDDAETILHKLTALVDVERDGHFATVLLGHVDVPKHQLTLVNAGHLPPLVVSGHDARFVETQPGTPIGVKQTTRYAPITVEVPQGASMLAYTDGLIERRGESLDTGLDRLRAAAVAGEDSPEALLNAVVSSVADEAVVDDVALLAVRWTD